MTALFTRRSTLAAAASAPLTALALPSCVAKKSPARMFDIGRLSAAGEMIDGLIESGQIPGGAVRISQHGELLFEHYAGKADIASGKNIAPDTIYRAYSMTKPVTAAAIMLLVEDNKLSLNDPVTAYVPEFSDLAVYVSQDGEKIVSEPAGVMRVAHLLTHTSGLSNSWNPGPISPLYRKAGLVSAKYVYDPEFSAGLSEFAARLGKIPLQFQPGSQWLYSISPDIAGLVVERVTGASFSAFLKERIFNPLGMEDADFYVPAPKAERLASMYALKEGSLILAEAATGSPFLTKPYAESGSAGLLCTLSDYHRFADMLAGFGEAGGARVMSRKSVRTMTAPHVGADVLGDTFQKFMGFASGGSGLGMEMALGGAVLTEPAAAEKPGLKGEYTWGGAASTTFFAVPEAGLSATLMTQLFPSGTLPLRDMLKTAVYQAMN
ncbi:serine hydrolase domain-containing protein [Hyphococcus luteus]|uniref:Serine hydrolase n=1 Tax=Hyphococcus luteus TaxID=2058213 RepID=A0A2S7K3V8_9PROT|nr:serine hydrolase domain-containing protein [Marinicaulis flavus]PQA87128.1 serine hydrolase [Marinicaulis flavus]